MTTLLPSQPHSPTSIAAAKAIEPVAKSQRDQVLDYIKSRSCYGGATDEEIQLALRMNPSTQRPRRVELVEAGLVFNSGSTRKTMTGRKAVVWEATMV